MSLSKNYIERLSKYKSSLYRLRSMGLNKIFSDNLADSVGVKPSQVRKDFSLFGIKGSKKGGYEVNELIHRVQTILGKKNQYDVVLIGIGNIGSGLIRYKGFEKDGINIVAGFDVDAERHKNKYQIPVFHVDTLKEYIQEHHIKLAILTVPEMAAQQVLDELVRAGIKGVLNFAPIRLVAPDYVVVNNVNLIMELENIIYYVNQFDINGSMDIALDDTDDQDE